MQKKHFIPFVLSALLLSFTGCGPKEQEQPDKPTVPDNVAQQGDAPIQDGVAHTQSEAGPEKVLPLVMGNAILLQPVTEAQVPKVVLDGFGEQLGLPFEERSIQSAWFGIASGEGNPAFLALPLRENAQWAKSLSPSRQWYAQPWGSIYLTDYWLIFTEQPPSEASKVWGIKEMAEAPQTLEPNWQGDLFREWLNEPAIDLLFPEGISSSFQATPSWTFANEVSLTFQRPTAYVSWSSSSEVLSAVLKNTEEGIILREWANRMIEQRDRDVLEALRTDLGAGYYMADQERQFILLESSRDEVSAKLLAFLFLALGAELAVSENEITGEWRGQSLNIAWGNDSVLILMGVNPGELTTTNKVPNVFLSVFLTYPKLSWLGEVFNVDSDSNPLGQWTLQPKDGEIQLRFGP